MPGSNLATVEIQSDYTGVTERHAHRRTFDERIDLTFYVNAEQYLPIKFFEAWIDYITGGNLTDQRSSQYFYRMNYSDEYTSQQGLAVTKFERDSYTPSEPPVSWVMLLTLIMNQLEMNLDIILLDHFH